jgi:hypothetical protein
MNGMLKMEEMIARWVRETKLEYERALKNQNLFRMKEMDQFAKALRSMRDRLIKLKT